MRELEKNGFLLKILLMLNPMFTTITVFMCLFGAAALGLRLKHWLPEHHLSSDAKDAVRVGMGSVATMAALVLGLLVASTKSAYDTEKAEVLQMSSKAIFLDQVLANYGPEAKEARVQLRHALESAIYRIWPKDEIKVGNSTPAQIWGETLPREIQKLAPRDDAQRAFKTQAAQIASELGQMRWLLFEQMESSVSVPLVVIMVFWLALTFLSVGLFAPPNGTVIAAQLLAALSVAGAVFLILELDQPFDGLIRISSRSMVNAVNHLSQMKP